MKKLEYKVFGSVFQKLTDLENSGLLKCDAKMLAEDISKQVAINFLSKQQYQIYSELDKHRATAVTTKYLSFATGLDSKSISSQLRQIIAKCDLIGIVKGGKNFKYYQL